MHVHHCRFCAKPLATTFVDLGLTPLSNDYLKPEDRERSESFHPLHARVCGDCKLVQLPQIETPEHIFTVYAYFSSYSSSWLKHCEAYSEAISARLGLGSKSLVVELASNDGYLLQYFQRKGVPVLGIEPAANVAQVAMDKGIPTLVRFFGVALARELVQEGRQADLIAANNVLAHVPDINDFVEGIRILLKPSGTATLEFPHLLRLMEQNQFDTIYHEHYSYLSLHTVERIFGAHGLEVVDVEELRTHGGSMRLHVRHAGATRGQAPAAGLLKVRADEAAAGLGGMEAYLAFDEKVKKVKRDLLRFLIDAKEKGKTVVGYGAPAKGNTLLNYCGVRTDFVDYTVDLSPHKQGHWLPGTRIPIHAPEKILATRPDYVLILPWNIREEIMEQMKAVRAWGGRFVVPIPEVKVL